MKVLKCSVLKREISPEKDVIKNGTILRFVVSNGVMTIEQFNSLDDGSKAVVIFEADKISEIRTDCTKFELFSIENFFVEARTSLNYNFKRTILTYTVNNLPSFYSSSMTIS